MNMHTNEYVLCKNKNEQTSLRDNEKLSSKVDMAGRKEKSQLHPTLLKEANIDGYI